MVSRRSFLKSLGAICGAAIIAPIALLKGEEPELSPYGILYWVEGKDGSCIEGIDCDAPWRWRNYYAEYHYKTIQTTN